MPKGICCRCHIPLTAENSNPQNWKYALYYCNDCYRTKQRLTVKRWREKNPDVVKAQNQKSYYKNRELIIQHKREYRLRHIDKMRQLDKIKNKKYKNRRWYNSLKFKYDLSPTDFWAMWKHQKGRCAICNTIMIIGKFPVVSNSMTVDHNHTDGTIRGLLCNNCNKASGIVETNLTNVMKYLQPQP